MVGYIRTDVGNNIENGEIADAIYLDQEFDGIAAAFNSGTGHNHDGTTGEGAPIVQLGPGQDFIASSSLLRPKTDDVYSLGNGSFRFKDLYLSGNIVSTNGISGKFGLSAGTAGSPSLYFVGDTDTGIWSGAANQISISTAGFSRLTIAPSGNVNIPQSVTIGGTLSVTGAITGASFTGDLNATNLTSGTIASARVNGVYSGITGVGALATGSIASGFGSINIGSNTITSGAITSSGTVVSSQNFSSSGNNAVVGNNGAGIVALRPQGAASATGQLLVSNNGNVTVNGDLSVTGTFSGNMPSTNISGTIASARLSGSYTGITQVGTLTDLTVDNMSFDNSDIYRPSGDNSFIRIRGGTLATPGAQIIFFGNTHSTNPGETVLDSSVTRIRSEGGSTTYGTFSVSGLTLGTNLPVVFSGTGAATTRTNLGLGTLATQDEGTGGAQFRDNLANDSRYLIAASNLGDLTNVVSSRANLGLGSVATLNAGTGSSDIRNNSQNDTRFHRKAIDTLDTTDLPTDVAARGWVGDRIAGNGTGTIGTHAFLRNNTGSTINPGDVVPATNLVYASGDAGASALSPSGTWRCMGYAPNAHTTLFVRAT